MLLQRHATLHEYLFDYYERQLSHKQLITRPQPSTNSVAWNLWHVSRAEDVGVNRFVADRPQVLNAHWMAEMNLPLRHHGYAMTSTEVDALNQAVNLTGLNAYRHAVAAQTRDVLANLDAFDLEREMDAERLRHILEDEGVAHPLATDLFESYLGRSGERNLFGYAITHGFQHVGEIDVIISLLGVTLA